MTTYTYSINLSDHTFFALKNLLEDTSRKIKEKEGLEAIDESSGLPNHVYGEILCLMNEAIKNSTINSYSSCEDEHNYSVGAAFSNQLNSFNPLWSAFIDGQDYFSRLGGSGRFIGFREWYIPCLVLMAALEITEPNDVVMKLKYQHCIPDELWSKSDDLHQIFTNQLKLSPISKQHVLQFIKRVTVILEGNQDSKELVEWQRFVASYLMLTKAYLIEERK